MPQELRVLLVEDRWMQADAFRLVLEDEPGVVLLPVVAVGAEAVRSSIEHHPDVVLVDIDIPGVDGFELTQQILEALPSTKVLLISAMLDPVHQRKAATVGSQGLVHWRDLLGDPAGTLGKLAVRIR